MAARAGDGPGSREQRWKGGAERPEVASLKVILYTVKKYLNIGADEWVSLAGDIQRVYLEGLADDEEIPFRLQESESSPTPGMQGPTIRRNVDAGVKTISISGMINELEELRKKKQQEREAS